MIKPEALAAMPDAEIAALIDRLGRTVVAARADLVALRAELKRRRAAPPPPSVDELAELLREPHFYMHCGFRSIGFGRYKTKPADRRTLAIVEIDGWQYTATFDDTRGYFVAPPPVYYGVNDWKTVGRRNGSTFFRRPKKAPPFPRPPLDYVEPGFISNAEFRKRMGIDDDSSV